MMREMIKADEVEYEPIFFDWQSGEWVHPRKSNVNINDLFEVQDAR